LKRERIDATELARGHWRYLLTQLGVSEEALSGRHTACPACGGEDRFRFDDKDGAGSHYCSGCGAGTGYHLIMKVKGCSFTEAFVMVQDLIKPDMPPEPTKKERTSAEKRASLNRLWASGVRGHGSIADYLVDRGISRPTAELAAKDLKYVEKMWDRDSKEHIPGIIGLMQRPGGVSVSIHRTYLLPDGKRAKKMMPPVDDILGSGIWFGDPKDDGMIIGEGIETAIAGWQLFNGFGCAVAAATAVGLEAFVVPDHVKHLCILVDNDANFTGQKAAFALAHRTAMRKAPIKILTVIPSTTGEDVLDCLTNGNQRFQYLSGGKKP